MGRAGISAGHAAARAVLVAVSVSGVLGVTRTSGMDYRNAPPHAFLYFEGTGDKTGSFTAKALEKAGNGHIVWDGGGGMGTAYTRLLGSWVELTD